MIAEALDRRSMRAGRGLKNPIEELLDGLGLKGHQRDVFLALLKNQEQETTMTIAYRAQVPVPKAYKILDEFASRGWVLTERKRPKRYSLQPVSTIVETERNEFESRWERLKSIADDLARARIPERGIMHLEADRPERFLILQKKTARVFNDAKERIKILTGSFWWAEEPEINEALLGALDRGVEVKLLWRPDPSKTDVVEDFRRKGEHFREIQLDANPGPIRLSIVDDSYAILVVFRKQFKRKGEKSDEGTDPSDVLVIAGGHLISLISDAFEYRWDQQRGAKS